jgi:putative colanic acid biosynthesis acetyltransferase WcaF
MTSSFSLTQRLARGLWQLSWLLLARSTPRPLHAWRVLLLRMWGARIGAGCLVYGDAVIWAPWHLSMGDGAAIGDEAEIYNVAPIALGARAVVSQKAFLCSASHDHRHEDFPLTSAPITLGERAWVAARAIVLPGVSIGAGAVVGAGSVVTRDVAPGCTVAGNPARVVRAAEAGSFSSSSA